jgi:hypothetical protein
MAGLARLAGLGRLQEEVPAVHRQPVPVPVVVVVEG